MLTLDEFYSLPLWKQKHSSQTYVNDKTIPYNLAAPNDAKIMIKKKKTLCGEIHNFQNCFFLRLFNRVTMETKGRHDIGTKESEKRGTFLGLPKLT